MQNLRTKIFNHPGFNLLSEKLKQTRRVHLSGLNGSFRSFLALFLSEQDKRPLLYIAADQDSAERMRDDLELIKSELPIAFLPALEFEPYDTGEPNPSLLSLRMETLQTTMESDHWIIVATPEGLMESFPPRENFLDEQVYIKRGMQIPFEELVNRLARIGFERADNVEQVGQFSVRGGLIDVFTWNAADPFRIEFFGDEVESIRNFDVLSQRSVRQLEEATILPNLENTEERAFIDQIVPETTILFCEDSQLLRQKAEDFFRTAENRYNALRNQDTEIAPPQSKYFQPEKLQAFLETKHLVESDLVTAPDVANVHFGIKPHPDFGGSMKRFLEYLRQRSAGQSHPQLYIQAVNQSQADRLQEIIDEEEIPFNGKCLAGTLHNGFRSDDLNLEILTDHEIFNRFKRRRTYKRFKSSAYLRQLSSLNLYDYVVHVDYGIGQYLGMETLEFGDVKKECLKIAYADGDHLFVTVDRLNRVQKYSTEEGVRPKLTRLGGSEWERTKKKTKESIKKVAAELIRIYAGRKAMGGHAFEEDNHWQRELEASFMFEETEDQLKSILEVKRDMQSDQPMDRLLCGDVGFGKTEVAIRACFKAVMNGKQAAVLVPTTILAFQHYQTFKERMREFPLEVEMINRFRSAKEQRQILEKLASGQIDIIIGTHRLLSEDVRFKDLGLLVVDEEQRFGVKQKEKLKKYRLSVDILSMTATPIPRTLHMALMGARDLSNIDTPPRNRLPVHTEIMHWDDDKLHYVIRRELERDGQVYFVHNRVETILAVKESLQQIVPQARIAVGHGQLPERQLEKVMLDFMNKKYDILLATMIIENGLDIPNVNTIIINRADKFGLSQLYQLRGRVGRSAQQAYAYLIVPPVDKLSATARKRLHAIQDFTDLGSGYKVALRDLEIRGAGNLLGKEQSGFVQSVGFDLYCKILDEAVNELKKGREDLLLAEEATNGEHKPYTDPKLDVDFDLLIPDSYLPSELERITVYHRLVNFSRPEQIKEMREELQDRFGQLPEEVDDFLAAIEIKILASRLYAERVILKEDRLKLIFSEKAQDDDQFFKKSIPTMMHQKLSEVRFLNQKHLGVEFRLKGETRAERLSFAEKILAYIIENE